MTPVAFGLFDWIDRGTAPLHQLYEERLQLLEATDAAGFFGYHLAEHYQYQGVPMELHPLQQPYPPLWYPTQNPESVGYAARHGCHFVGLGPAVNVRQHVDLYWQTWEANRHNSDRLNGHVAARKVGILRPVCVADTDAEAWAAAHAAHADWYRSIMKLWHDHDDHTHDAVFAWELSLQGETLLVGSPARVREQLARLLDESGCNYVIGAFAWGSLPHAQALHSLRLFAEEVMPAFSRWD